jgi:hypothetical protein
MKDKKILQLLSHLKQAFGKDSFRVNDHWDGDLCAIGLTDINETYLLYVSTFGKPESTYYAELEERRQQDSIGKPTATFEHLTKIDLEQVFRQYIVGSTT